MLKSSFVKFAVEGFQMWLSEGLNNAPEEVLNATSAYFSDKIEKMLYLIE
jgi:hypothetical protein